MDYLEWAEAVFDLTGNFAWPITVITIVLLFRRQILGFLDPDRVETVEAGSGGVKLTMRKIGKDLADAREVIEGSLGAVNATESRALPEHSRRVQEIASIDPPAATFAAAAHFESVLRRRLPVDDDPAMRRGARIQSLRGLIDRAVREGVFSKEQAEGARRLNNIRNEIAHEYDSVEMSAEQAIEFCELARKLESAIQ
ncbi:hypothetical protein [Brachybacterium vulturis]|uniref:hypothetical protein n=1 Tax=Brachybacterium vulturis TaxID=2017484 RepID=UPI003736E32A